LKKKRGKRYTWTEYQIQNYVCQYLEKRTEVNPIYSKGGGGGKRKILPGNRVMCIRTNAYARYERAGIVLWNRGGGTSDWHCQRKTAHRRGDIKTHGKSWERVRGKKGGLRNPKYTDSEDRAERGGGEGGEIKSVRGGWFAHSNDSEKTFLRGRGGKRKRRS